MSFEGFSAGLHASSSARTLATRHHPGSMGGFVTVAPAFSAAARAGFHPRAGIETNDVGRASALVAEGLGVAVLPDSDARCGGPDTVVVALRAPALRCEIFVAWRAHRHLTPAADALRSTIKEHASEDDHPTDDDGVRSRRV